MKKKLLILLAAVVVFAGLGFAFKQFMPEKEIGSKELTITIRNTVTDKVLYEKVIRTDATTLGELLDEREDMEVEFLDSDFGRFIIALKGVRGTEDYTSYWLYGSENNKDCKDAGFCTGADLLNIYDGDIFEFTFHGSN